MGFENHFLTWAASIFCCFGVLILLIRPISYANIIYESNLFLPTYSIGILSWFLHGLTIKSMAIILPCGVQLVALVFLLKRMIDLRTVNGNGGLNGL